MSYAIALILAMLVEDAEQNRVENAMRGGRTWCEAYANMPGCKGEN